MIYSHQGELDFDLESLPKLQPPGNVLLARPDYYAIEYVINPYMEGNIGTVDKQTALRQWHDLRTAYRTLGFPVHEIQAREGYPDLVFTANQSLPFRLPDDRTGVLLGRMGTPQRAGEVDVIASFFDIAQRTTDRLPADMGGSFEGTGDALWHGDRFLLWGGYGHRTDPHVYEYISSLLGVRVLTLELVDPLFYHLDTCLGVLSSDAAIVYPRAFDEAGWELINGVFDRVIIAPEHEARSFLACNAHCPDGRHVLIDERCTDTCEMLVAAGFVPIPLDTSEFLKAGGSVFCMKLMFW